MRGVGLIMFLIFFGLPVLFFVWFLKKGLKGAKADEWKGEVVDKTHNSVEDEDEIHEYYSIIFKTDKGGRKIATNSKDYLKWKIGDKAIKIKDKFGVERL